jgi:hypothetical protein
MSCGLSRSDSLTSGCCVRVLRWRHVKLIERREEGERDRGKGGAGVEGGVCRALGSEDRGGGATCGSGRAVPAGRGNSSGPRFRLPAPLQRRLCAVCAVMGLPGTAHRPSHGAGIHAHAQTHTHKHTLCAVMGLPGTAYRPSHGAVVFDPIISPPPVISLPPFLSSWSRSSSLPRMTQRSR